MQRKIANRVQMIHHQLTGPTTASRLECHTLQSRLLAIAANMSVYKILRASPMAGNLRSRVTRVVKRPFVGLTALLP